MKRRLLIIDTDAGIDDAMALCMAFDAHARGDIEVGRQKCQNTTGWSIWSRNTVCCHQIKSSAAVKTSYTKVQLLFQCQQKFVLVQMDYPVHTNILHEMHISFSQVA